VSDLAGTSGLTGTSDLAVAPAQHVFGYGSLTRCAEDAQTAPLRMSRLNGYRRTWNVAMDNTVDVPGYKHYLSDDGRSRPRAFVTFLNVVAAPATAVNGVLLPVDDERLAALDRRERNYERIEVGELLDTPVAGRVWCYVASAEARERFELGMTRGTALVDAHYRDAVREGFALLGAAALAEFDASTDPPRCAVAPLLRVDLP
jgi:cation transport regulator ChaC